MNYRSLLKIQVAIFCTSYESCDLCPLKEFFCQYNVLYISTLYSPENIMMKSPQLMTMCKKINNIYGLLLNSFKCTSGNNYRYNK